MRKIFVFVLLALLSLSTIAFAEGLSALSGLAQEGERIVGSLEIGRDFPLQVDMAVPKTVPGPVKQYKMRRIEITQQQIRALLSGKTQPAKAGEKWEIWTMDRTEFRQFIYQQESLLYGIAISPHLAPCPLPPEQPDPALQLADQQTLRFLDTWGVPYEYPFYTICNAMAGVDISLRNRPFRTGRDVQDYLLTAGNQFALEDHDFMSKQKMFDDEYTIVRTRQQADGIPFALFAIKSPYYRPDNPQFDEGIYVLLQFNSRGEIVFADACNLHTVVAESGEPLPVLGWPECLAALTGNDVFFDGKLEAKVIDAELCYAINGKHMTYPVWQFMVEFKQALEPSLQQYLCFPVYVDACSGLPL